MSTQPVDENVLVTGDGHVREYRRSFDVLDITVVLWDETVTTIRAEGVAQLHDRGTWECDALVLHPALDDGDLRGYAVIDTDGTPTLTFAARQLVIGSPESAVVASISDHVARSAPLAIAEVEFQDPILALSGEGWALTAMCPWRVLRGDALELSWSTPDAEDRAWDLIGRQLVAADQRGRDAVLRLSDGSVIELFSDTDTDPWILRLPGLTFVGPLPPP